MGVHEHEAAWRELQRRRRTFFLAVAGGGAAGFIAAILLYVLDAPHVFANVALLVPVAVGAIMLKRTLAFACPSCGEEFSSGKGVPRLSNRVCVHCGCMLQQG